MDEHLYIVVYDIRDPRRWRRIYRLMHGYGDWLQLSVFQCRLGRMRHAELIADLDLAMNKDEDHVVILDIGVADRVSPRVVSLGEPFKPIERGPTIV